MDHQASKFNTYDFVFKVIFLGAASVGKTALLSRFCDDNFSDSYQSTIGIDFRIKTIKLGDQTIKIQIWDTAGQERYQAIATNHYKGTDGVFCVFDISNKESFDKVKENINKCKNIVEIPEDCMFIVGNKTSAKNGENVVLIFNELVKNIIKNKKLNDGLGQISEKQNLSVEKTGHVIEKKVDCAC